MCRSKSILLPIRRFWTFGTKTIFTMLGWPRVNKLHIFLCKANPRQIRHKLDESEARRWLMPRPSKEKHVLHGNWTMMNEWILDTKRCIYSIPTSPPVVLSDHYQISLYGLHQFWLYPVTIDEGLLQKKDVLISTILTQWKEKYEMNYRKERIVIKRDRIFSC